MRSFSFVFVLLFSAIVFAQSPKETATPTPPAIEPAAQSSEAAKADELKPVGSEPNAQTEAKGLPPSAEPTPIPETPPIVEAPEKPEPSRDYSRFGIGYAGAFLGYPIPSKHGIDIAWNPSKSWRLELSYVAGDFGLSNSFIDVASVKETLIAVHSRHFLTKTFNLVWGFAQQTYDAKLGSSLVSSASGSTADLDVFRIKTLGGQFGLGNVWQPWDWMRIGIDYLVINVPFKTQEQYVPSVDRITDDGDRRKVQDAINIASKTPTAMIGRITWALSF